MNVTPPGERSAWCRPRLTTTTSPGPSVCVSSSIVISTSPSRMNMTCSVSSCLCQGTSFPGSYRTRQSSTCSPPIAWIRTPSTNSYESRPFQVRNGPGASVIGGEEPRAAVRRDRPNRDLLVEDDPLAVAPRLGLPLERSQHPLGRRRHLRDPDSDGVVDRGRDRRGL